MLNRTTENLTWNNPIIHDHQPHDRPAEVTTSQKHYFGPATYYCLETICAPCGIVIAWKKFAKSELPTKIVDFITQVYSTSQNLNHQQKLLTSLLRYILPLTHGQITFALTKHAL